MTKAESINSYVKHPKKVFILTEDKGMDPYAFDDLGAAVVKFERMTGELLSEQEFAKFIRSWSITKYQNGTHSGSNRRLRLSYFLIS
jgi:hypothetical protein